MKYYWFTKIADDGSRWSFRKKFHSAFKADEWAMKKFHLWMNGTVTFRIVFDA